MQHSKQCWQYPQCTQRSEVVATSGEGGGGALSPLLRDVVFANLLLTSNAKVARCYCVFLKDFSVRSRCWLYQPSIFCKISNSHVAPKQPKTIDVKIQLCPRCVLSRSAIDPNASCSQTRDRTLGPRFHDSLHCSLVWQNSCCTNDVCHYFLVLHAVVYTDAIATGSCIMMYVCVYCVQKPLTLTKIPGSSSSTVLLLYNHVA